MERNSIVDILFDKHWLEVVTLQITIDSPFSSMYHLTLADGLSYCLLQKASIALQLDGVRSA